MQVHPLMSRQPATVPSPSSSKKIMLKTEEHEAARNMPQVLSQVGKETSGTLLWELVEQWRGGPLVSEKSKAEWRNAHQLSFLSYTLTKTEFNLQNKVKSIHFYCSPYMNWELGFSVTSWFVSLTHHWIQLSSVILFCIWIRIMWITAPLFAHFYIYRRAEEAFYLNETTTTTTQYSIF